jgi:WD40 repeat protein
MPSNRYRINQRVTISHNTSEVFCTRYSPDGNFIAVGCGDSSIRIFNTKTGESIHILQSGSSVSLPTTCIRFRPSVEAGKTKNVFIASNAGGLVQHFHMASGKCLHTTEEPGNQIYALDYNSDGSMYCSAGRDRCIKLYDEETKTLSTTLSGGFMGFYEPTAPGGHSNRVFCTKFVPHDNNLIISGGWDNTVQIWDIRVGDAVRSIYGPHICGESLDMVGNEVLTGSWRPKNQLEVWDFGKGTKKADVAWGPKGNRFDAPNEAGTYLYAAQFSKEGHGRFIAAGGSGKNEARVFDHQNDDDLIGTITGLTRGVFSVDFSPMVNTFTGVQSFAVAGGDATIRIMDIERVNQEEK